MTFRDSLEEGGRAFPVLKPRILVVDDDPNIRELIMETLGGADFDVLEARDGGEALELSAKELPTSSCWR